MTLILGRKRGMTQLFADDGTVTGVTVVEVGPVRGHAGQARKRAKVTTPSSWAARTSPTSASRSRSVGHFKKAGVATKRFLREDRLSAPADKKVGDALQCDVFNVGDIVDVVGTIEGPRLRGHDQAPRLPARSRDPRLHERAPTGFDRPAAASARSSRASASAGHYGVERHTSKNLAVVRIDAELATSSSCAARSARPTGSSRSRPRVRATAEEGWLSHEGPELQGRQGRQRRIRHGAIRRRRSSIGR